MENIFKQLDRTTADMGRQDFDDIENKLEDEFCEIVRSEWMNKFGKEPENSDEFAKNFGMLDLSGIKVKYEEYIRPLLGEYYAGDVNDLKNLDEYTESKFGYNYWNASFAFLLPYTFNVDEYHICQAVFDM